MSRQQWEYEADGHDPSKSVLCKREGSLAEPACSVRKCYRKGCNKRPLNDFNDACEEHLRDDINHMMARFADEE